MKSFGEFLTEGGAVKVGKLGANPIDTSENNRIVLQHDVHHALSAIHNSFHHETGAYLFGKHRKALTTGSAYSGSTRHLMSAAIPHKEYAMFKPSTGDIDVQIPKEHADSLSKHLSVGKRFGHYTVAGLKKHGAETSALMTHRSGQTHQFDFEHVDYDKDEPTKASGFLHSSDWGDTKAGIKGAHHKMLLNAVGGSTHKFSITHGLRSRTDLNDKGNGDPEHVSKTLFGDKADHAKINSFRGVAELIKTHIPSSQHASIYNKFKESSASKKSSSNLHALKHLQKAWGINDTIKEAKQEEHHASVIPMVGFSPISHMGHSIDLGGALAKLPGTKHVGISSKADVFSPEERSDIMRKQWGHIEHQTHIVHSAGETVANAYHAMPSTGRKVLHMLVGSDRKDFAEKLKTSLNAGKIKEMKGHKYDEVNIHYPEDQERKHGLSGTRMRGAAATGDVKVFRQHLGSMFDDKQSLNIMQRIKHGLDSKQIKIKR